ncbi:hypothetical protein KC19_4G104300 [Ceratodon purpureus]|uniref:Peroxisomal membrane protein PMP22 n=1 Tax=Ceratodon purpureus TaxID=3225 RepID=A0A8T0IAI8_CERPU|nr:hypothetical protein KC19_4G104300 [Ceratodon purpureus]
MADEVKALWGQYLGNLQRHPLRTKAITAGVLAGSADVIAQKLAGAKNLQLRRSVLLMLYGFCYSGPFGHYFHQFMNKLFPPSQDSKTIVSKVSAFFPIVAKLLQYHYSSRKLLVIPNVLFQR